MKYKLLKSIFWAITFIVVSNTNIANANFITVDNWHLTTDNLGGFRQSSASDQVYYAVSKIWKLDRANTFETIEGYHFASYQEWRDLVGVGYNPNKGYRNQGGWNEYEWEGIERSFFLFSDSIETGWYKHAGNSDTTANITGFYQGREGIAGFVMIKNALISPTAIIPVTESSTIVIFAFGILALVARKFSQ
ncbi:hypothetical protein [Thalassotalea piscium]|uniref:PEP-CTERM sorting domain-containing protein n=1 Tax=Thalassotalea piscium TaxID=1230533 RepID=A0A7X0TT01_9GAMM|nr:hypothetical protein [Thalassotalea piscium]MBB6542668.1 hypothetical protein [Thalassotalea piscium]